MHKPLHAPCIPSHGASFLNPELICLPSCFSSFSSVNAPLLNYDVHPCSARRRLGTIRRWARGTHLAYGGRRHLGAGRRRGGHGAGRAAKFEQRSLSRARARMASAWEITRNPRCLLRPPAPPSATTPPQGQSPPLLIFSPLPATPPLLISPPLPVAPPSLLFFLSPPLFLPVPRKMPIMPRHDYSHLGARRRVTA